MTILIVPSLNSNKVLALGHESTEVFKSLFTSVHMLDNSPYSAGARAIDGYEFPAHVLGVSLQSRLPRPYSQDLAPYYGMRTPMRVLAMATLSAVVLYELVDMADLKIYAVIQRKDMELVGTTETLQQEAV